MTLTIKRGNIRYYVLFLVLCVEHQLFYLVPASWNILGVDYQGISVLLELFVFFESLAEFGFKLRKSKYNWMFYLGLILVATSAFAAASTYGQDLLMGLIVQRTRISSLLFFFALLQWYKNGKITIEGIWKTLITFAIIYASICAMQYLLSDVVTFTYSTVSEKVRYGEVRYWFNGTYLVFLAGYGLDRILSKDNRKLINVFLAVFPFLLLFVITKTRMAALALLCSFFICFTIRDGLTTKKILRILIVVTISLVIIPMTSLGKDLIDIFINRGIMTEDTLSVRNIGRTYYIAETIKKPIRFLFGCGYASANNNAALTMTYPQIYSSIYGYSVTLYPQDNGIFGAFYYYGIFGIIWWISIIFCILKKGWKIYKNTGNTVFVAFALYEMVSCLTLMPSSFGRYILQAIVIILLIGSEDLYLKRSYDSL